MFLLLFVTIKYIHSTSTHRESYVNISPTHCRWVGFANTEVGCIPTKYGLEYKTTKHRSFKKSNCNHVFDTYMMN